MASHPTNSLGYFLSLPTIHKDYLGAVRHWENLKVGFEEDFIWVKDLTTIQVDSLEIKSMPHKTVYYSQGPSLYKQGSLLPERNLPSLLWTPIGRGLPVRLPSLNHHFFGVDEKLSIHLVPTDEEQESFALSVVPEDLQRYTETAPAVRLQRIQWVIADQKALLLGTPVLPVRGDVFWREGDFLLPAGFHLEFPLLHDTLQAQMNPKGENWIIWQPDGRYWKVAKADLRTLSIGSLRQTFKN